MSRNVMFLVVIFTVLMGYFNSADADFEIETLKQRFIEIYERIDIPGTPGRFVAFLHETGISEAIPKLELVLDNPTRTGLIFISSLCLLLVIKGSRNKEKIKRDSISIEKLRQENRAKMLEIQEYKAKWDRKALERERLRLETKHIQKKIEQREKADEREVKKQKRAEEYERRFMEGVDKRLRGPGFDANATDLEKSREWFVSMIAEAYALQADVAASALRKKKPPAKKKADEIAGPIKDKMRQLKKENRRLKLELEIFDECFPDYAGLREHILESDEAVSEVSEDGERTDRVRRFISAFEYKELTEIERNQLALDNYLKRNHSQQEIGRFYERYIGYCYEVRGWKVKFEGLVAGFEDLGRDLICTKDGATHIVQVKNWSKARKIHEKHIFQLFATKTHYCIERGLSEDETGRVKAVFITTTSYSEMACKVAECLDVTLEQKDLSKTYPMIKCNINPEGNTRIYHLPFDQQYDKVIIGDQEGEFYAQDVEEAVSKDYRRAFRWRGGRANVA